MDVAAVLLGLTGDVSVRAVAFRIALITATMFSAVNSPTPRVLFGMVVSGGGGGVRLLRVGGAAQSGAVELSRLWALVCKAGQQRSLAGLFGLVSCPVRAAKRAAHSSRPSWVVVPCRRLSQPDARFAIIRHSVSTSVCCGRRVRCRWCVNNCPVFAGRHSVCFARVEARGGTT